MTTHTSVEAGKPSLALALSEIPRASSELGLLFASLSGLSLAPRGKGQPVLVLPGFLATDLSTTALRLYLSFLGYDVYGWGLGRNMGPTTVGADSGKLLKRLGDIHTKTGMKVNVIGWSLGGVMARHLAHLKPESVRQVITLGSPIRVNPYKHKVFSQFKTFETTGPDGATTMNQFAENRAPPPVPATAIYSEEDGIVRSAHCREFEGKFTESIRVRGSHLGLSSNPATLAAIANRLAQPPGTWVPFVPRTYWSSLFYPAAAAH